jgi:hypothetical protein
MAIAGRGGVRIPIITEFDAAGIDRFAKKIGGLGNTLTKNVTAPLLGAGAVLVAFAKGAEDAEIANRKLGNVLASMGYGEATARVSAYAEELERTLAIDADVIKATQTKLATFKNLTASVDESGGAFDRATLAALDLAAAGFGEAETNAVQLGKALQDPIKGITALGRAGVTFTQQEKDKIRTLVESNRMLEAQDVVLSAIEEQVGGTAEAGASSFERIRLSLMQVADEIGLAVLPIIQQMAEYVSTQLVPQIVPRVRAVADAFKGLSSTARNVLLGAVGLIAGLGPLLIALGAVTKAVLLLGKAFIFLFKAKILIPLIIIGIIGAFRAQSDAQYQLAKESGQTWKQIVIIIEKGIGFILGSIEHFVNGLKVINLALDHFGRVVDNVFNKLAGKPVDSLMTFEERLRSLVTHQFVDFTSGIDEISKTIESFVTSFSEIETSMQAAQVDMTAATRDAADLESEIKDLGDGSAKSATKINKLKEALQNVREAAVKAAQAVVDNLNESLNRANARLDEARSRFNDFRDALIGSIRSVLNFGQAAESANFLSGLTEQAADAASFADKIKQLVVLGLSERGIQELLDAGFEAGTRIADELIAGGATAVQQVNTLIDSVDQVAAYVGDFGAKQFHQAGITQGEALVNGILEALRNAQEQLAAAQRAALSGAQIGSFTNLGVRATGLLTRIEGISDEKKRTRALADFQQALEQSKGAPAVSKKELANITKKYKLAKGGIVMGPTNALIGEAGPEAVIPLSGPNSKGVGGTFNITVNAGLGTNGSDVGRQIVEAIKRFERTSGPVFAGA